MSKRKPLRPEKIKAGLKMTQEDVSHALERIVDRMIESISRDDRLPYESVNHSPVNRNGREDNDL